MGAAELLAVGARSPWTGSGLGRWQGAVARSAEVPAGGGCPGRGDRVSTVEDASILESKSCWEARDRAIGQAYAMPAPAGVCFSPTLGQAPAGEGARLAHGNA